MAVGTYPWHIIGIHTKGPWLTMEPWLRGPSMEPWFRPYVG